MLKTVIWCVLFTEVAKTQGQSMQDEYKLHLDLLVHSNYSKHIRPYITQSEVTVVNVTFDLISIRELDEIIGKLSVVGILRMVWLDPRLTWDNTMYGNASYTSIDMQEVWKPSLIIVPPADVISAVGFDQFHYPVFVSSNGTVAWAPGDVMTTSCTINIAYYPFDTQICQLKFLYWGFFKFELILRAVETEISTRMFVTHGEWELINAYASEQLLEGVYPVYFVVLELRRRPTFVIVNIVMPILLMGALNILVFILPSESGERVSFSITVLLALAVFLTVVGDNMPKTSEPMPTISYFLLTNLVLSSVIMVLTILNLSLYHRSDLDQVPVWLTKLVFMLNCKCTKHTKVEDIETTTTCTVDDVTSEPSLPQEKALPVMEKKWVASELNTESKITWQQTSKTLDKVFGFLASISLFLSAAVFFILVLTKSVPGAD
ncbi:hypothetical protein ACF0H5_016220 [Mactra antiquata]